MTGLQNSENFDLSGFDWRNFGKCCQHFINEPIRDFAKKAGVTATDVQRATRGQRISIDRVIAISKCIGFDFMEYYIEPNVGVAKWVCDELDLLKQCEEELAEVDARFGVSRETDLKKTWRDSIGKPHLRLVENRQKTGDPE